MGARPGGVATRDPRTGAWTRDGRPYTNDQVPDPTLHAAHPRPMDHGQVWEPVPGLPKGVPLEGVTPKGESTIVQLDGGQYRLGTAEWAAIADQYPVAATPLWDQHVMAMWLDDDGRVSFSAEGDGGEVLHDTGAGTRAHVRFLGRETVFATTKLGGHVWVLQASGTLVSRDLTLSLAEADAPPVAGYVAGSAGAALSDRVAAFVRDGVTYGRPDIPVRPLAGATDGDRWWLLLEDGTLLDSDGPARREVVPVHDAVALARVGDRLCVGGATLACRADGGGWKTVSDVDHVVSLAPSGDTLWMTGADSVCRVTGGLRCLPVPDGVRSLAPDGMGGAWVLTRAGLRHADRRLGPVVVTGAFNVLARGDDGAVRLAGISLVRHDPATGAQTETPLPGAARAIAVEASGGGRVRVGDAELDW